ncbi:MAG TPA: porin family protein [Sphingomonadaceae bacterium]|nr:porin family protein [Sphingomonadaceae bacterium]
MRKFIVAALLAGTIATPALAQDAAPVVATGTGPRIEILGGYDAPKDGLKNGFTYGVGAGFDFQVGNATAGVEAEYMDTNVERCTNSVVTPSDELCAGLGRDLYVGGRFGVASFAGSSVYVKGGYTNQRVRAELDNTGVTGADNEAGQNLDGARIGVGAEFAIPTLGFGSAAFVKTEYRYSNYEQGFEKHTGVVGVGFRF